MRLLSKIFTIGLITACLSLLFRLGAEMFTLGMFMALFALIVALFVKPETNSQP